MTIPPELEPSIPTWAVMGQPRRDHARRVAELAARWADALGLPAAERSRWLQAAWLHDALRDAAPAVLAAIEPTSGQFPPELLHGPAAATRAAAMGNTDAEVLEAVRYHSVGSRDWGPIGRMLYCADFLEPGRRFDAQARAALADRFPADPGEVFREVVEWRLRHLLRSRWPVPPSTFELWNSLVGPSREGPQASSSF